MVSYESAGNILQFLTDFLIANLFGSVNKGAEAISHIHSPMQELVIM